MTPVSQLVQSVRRRWKRLLMLQAAARGALVSAGAALMLVWLAGFISGSSIALALIGVLALLLAGAAVGWAARAMRQLPDDSRVARFVEEQQPVLDDRLVSAIHVQALPEGERPILASSMLADADRAAAEIDPAAIIPDARLRKAGFQAAGALVALVAILFAGRAQIRRSYDALSLVLFPSRVTLEVTPGAVRIEAGKPLTIQARLAGNRAPVVAQLFRAPAEGGDAGGDDAWQMSEMRDDGSGTFRFAVDAVDASFKYRVTAGAITSSVYDVTVAYPPRVVRVDLEYRYPRSLGLAPHTEQDSGDIYAPAGTDVRVHVHADRASATGLLRFGDGKELPLAHAEASGGAPVLTAALKVAANGSYRIALSEPEGLSNPGETEYFIRTLDDRPPEVHVRKPARDRNVTMLEEVEIEAEASDDFGIDQFDLVYSVRGAIDKVVPLTVPKDQTSVSATHTLYLEDMEVQPGDFVSYYLRARDRGRGRRSSEGRSDIFFLQVKPFEQEFELARSQGAGGSGNKTIDDLVAAQKEVIVATWKLDRRSQAADGARSEHDIRAVAKVEDDLRKRVEAASSAFRESNMRDPRRPDQGQAARATQLRPEENAMTAAARSMAGAVASLNRLRTNEAIPQEMEALNHLLKAQSDVKRQQVVRQAGQGGNNRSAEDMSSLFDRELQRDQQTNYETPSTTGQRDQAGLADEIKELARRQDEINRRQEQIARMTPEERRRELDKLTREQAELRQRADDLARQMDQGSRGSQGSQGSQGSRGSQGSQGSQSNPLRAASEEMRGAAGELQRQDGQRAAERGARAAQQLRAAERQVRAAGGPDERRRALGEMQLEARQLADAERQIAGELNRLMGSQGSRGSQGSQGSQSSQGSVRDTLRRLAGEQERLADRARQVQDDLQQAAALAGNSGDSADTQRAIGAAAGDANRQRLAERMRQGAEQLRAASAQGDEKQAGAQGAKAAASQEAIARELDSLADKIAAAQSPQDPNTRRLAEQRARAQELRQDLDRLAAEIERIGQEASGSGRSNQQAQGDNGRAGRGQSGTGGGGSDLARLRQEYTQKLQEAQKLIDQLRREDPSFAQGGPGITFEGQGMTLSAPGTEAFKQDFAKWERLRQQATLALGRAEASLSQRMQAAATQDRLPAGANDRVPAGYQKPVDDYFKSLATRTR